MSAPVGTVADPGAWTRCAMLLALDPARFIEALSDGDLPGAAARRLPRPPQADVDDAASMDRFVAAAERVDLSRGDDLLICLRYRLYGDASELEPELSAEAALIMAAATTRDPALLAPLAERAAAHLALSRRIDAELARGGAPEPGDGEPEAIEHPARHRPRGGRER